MKTTDPQSIRIVLADDHAVVREGTRILLDREDGLTVVGEAADGSEAITLVGELRPDVAILDIAMPNTNGIQATTEIKRRWPQTSVLVLTGYDDDEYVYAMIDAGAAGYLLKDVPAEEVIHAVRAIHAGEPVLHPHIMQKLMDRASKPTTRDSLNSALSGDISAREREVMGFAALGLTNSMIADELSLSSRTVQTHLRNIFVKLGVSSRTEAVVRAIKLGLVVLEKEPKS
jgi:two-component system, NarL family, response regulator LiaR